MAQPERTMELVDTRGPYAGELRLYPRSVGQRMLERGWAEHPVRGDAGAEVRATPLPADFPGRQALLGRGIETLEAIPSAHADLKRIQGVGDKVARQILKALKAS